MFIAQPDHTWIAEDHVHCTAGPYKFEFELIWRYIATYLDVCIIKIEHRQVVSFINRKLPLGPFLLTIPTCLIKIQ